MFGDIVTGRIDASELLVEGRVLAEDQQTGCFRFSAALTGGRVPHPYQSHFFAGALPAGLFVSRRFGEPGYAQLPRSRHSKSAKAASTASRSVRSSGALDPIKRADLTAKLREFLPINAIAQLIFET